MTTITTKEFQTLKKMMDLTFSQNDGEALNAMRAANALLAKHDLNWKSVLERVVSVDVEAAPYEPPAERTQTQRAIDDAFEALRDDWSPFIASLYDQWEKKQWLSQPQRAALFKNVDRMK